MWEAKPKLKKTSMRQIVLNYPDVQGPRGVVLPLPHTREDEENLGRAVQVRPAPDSQCKFPQILLIECMLEKMCAIYENDQAKQKELYDTLRRYLAKFHLLPKVNTVPEMESLKVHFAADLNKLFCLAKHDVSAKDSSLSDAQQLAIAKPSPLSGTIWASIDGREHLFTSRYELDFEEIEFIAAGGFGVVYKSRNILDDKEYAIKKIVIRPNSAAQIIREVQLLSSLNHPNIVSYKSAWLEYCSPQILQDILQRMEGSPFSSPGSSSYESSTEASQSYEVKSTRSFMSDRSQSIVFEHSSRTETSIHHTFHSREARSTTTRTSSHNGIVSAVSSSSMFSNRTSHVYWDRIVRPTVLLLYLQMQLCTQTLRQWLNVRNQQSVFVENLHVEMDIFRQILQGVIYIHSNNIIHRDIKPENIFIDGKTRQIQIGDFGLAKLKFENGNTSVVRPVNLQETVRHGTRGVGTQSYAAPEQLASKDSDWKSDIYSLGIVFLELLCPFKTDMERHRTIQKLRNHRIIPDDIKEKWPHLAALLLKMISEDPVQRPSAAEVMAELLASKTAVAKHQQKDVECLPCDHAEAQSVSHLLLVIESLKKELAEKNLLIEKLLSRVAQPP